MRQERRQERRQIGSAGRNTIASAHCLAKVLDGNLCSKGGSSVQHLEIARLAFLGRLSKSESVSVASALR